MQEKLKWIRKSSGVYRLDMTPDVICLVSWNLLKRDIVVRKTNKGLHQLLKPSQNQYKYRGAVLCEKEKKTVFGNNLEMVKRMLVCRARKMMEKRIVEYHAALQKKVVYE